MHDAAAKMGPPCWHMCSTKRCTNPCPTPTDGSRGQNGSRCKSQIPPGSRWAWLSEQWQFNLSLIPTIIGHTSKSLCIPALELATTCTSLSSCPSCPHQEHRIPIPWLSKFSALICFFQNLGHALLLSTSSLWSKTASAPYCRAYLWIRHGRPLK